MNDSEKKSEHSRYLQDEYYGFLKPRMWDQYADKYKGVCLAFSLKKLRDQAGSLPNDLVKYMSYNHLEQHYYSFDEYLICKIGVDEYVSKLSDYIKTRMFKKHKDYSGENEYRFLSFSGSEYDYIDIEGCLTGIIISNNSSEFMKKALNEYAEKYNVELLNINWDSSGISIITKKENDKLISSIREFNE